MINTQPSLHVCPLSALERVMTHSKAPWMISLCGPGKKIPRPKTISKGFLSLEFNDIHTLQEGLIAPDNHHITALIDFARQWNRQDDLIIHCWMGISRSTASALIIMALFNPHQDMNTLAKRLRQLSPMATPNPLMIALADQQLGLEGRLIESVKRIGRGEEAYEGQPFSFQVP